MGKEIKAFPHKKIDSSGYDVYVSGMDLRDYFAAKFIDVVFKMIKHDLDKGLPEGYSWNDAEDYDDIAERAYEMATAMMKAREKNYE
jgi:hypothetical protein